MAVFANAAMKPIARGWIHSKVSNRTVVKEELHYVHMTIVGYRLPQPILYDSTQTDRIRTTSLLTEHLDHGKVGPFTSGKRMIQSQAKTMVP